MSRFRDITHPGTRRYIRPQFGKLRASGARKMLSSREVVSPFVKRLVAIVALAACAASAHAGPREQAKRIHDRIAGVPPSASVLGQMETLVQNGDDERSEEHTSELQSPCNLVCRLLLENKK